MDKMYKKYINLLYRHYRQSNSALDPARIWTNLDQINNEYNLLMSHVQKEIHKSRLVLESRIAMQKAMKKADMDEQSLAIFYQDQFVHYFSVLDDFKKGVGNTVSPCVVHLSTKNILLLLRICRDLRIVSEAPLIEHVTFISTCFETSRQSEISIQSLRKKYSKLDKRIVDEVKLILEKMIDKLGEYRVDST